MSDPALHLLVGPNGAGKTTLFDRVIGPITHLPFVNADRIAASLWPGDAMAHAREASQLAAQQRSDLIAARTSFVSETVFSHDSKVALVREAHAAGYLVTLHVVLVPVELSIARVAARVRNGGHDVPEQKIRERHDRLWPLVAQAAADAEEVVVYDNSAVKPPFRRGGWVRAGLVLQDDLPAWAPEALRDWAAGDA